MKSIVALSREQSSSNREDMKSVHSRMKASMSFNILVLIWGRKHDWRYNEQHTGQGKAYIKYTDKQNIQDGGKDSTMTNLLTELSVDEVEQM